MSKEIRDLIRLMSSDNGWGAPRIHGELLMLGLDVSERTISRYLQRLGRRPEARQSWLTFLHNHREALAAMDLFVVFTVKFRLLYHPLGPYRLTNMRPEVRPPLARSERNQPGTDVRGLNDRGCGRLEASDRAGTSRRCFGERQVVAQRHGEASVKSHITPM